MTMKTTIALLITSVLAVTVAFAGTNHEPGVAGPNGGRVITEVEPHAEFFVTPDRKVQITFLNDDGKAIAPASQVVSVTTGDRQAPTKLTFAAKDGVLLSEQELPAGNDLPTVVQIKSSPDAKAVVERFHLNLATCSGCKLAEYACTCAHSH
jgi:hypothetical protein